MNWDDHILAAAATDTGMRRANNQDYHAVVRASNPDVWRSRGHVFIVADGMGAHAVGEMASRLACENIPHNYKKVKVEDSVEAITKAYQEVGSLIHTKAAANREFQGMGTTCSTLILKPEGALIAHVGDSRVYRTREDRIDQLSFDHSLAWELVRRNHLSLEEAKKAVPRNVITRSLGPDPNTEVDIEGPLPVRPGDVFVICSDGLSGPVEDHEIGVFAANFHPNDAARYLVQFANLRGGFDNITVVIVRIGPWIEPDSAPDMANLNGQDHRKSSPRHGFLNGLARMLRPGRSVQPEKEVKERIYQTFPCPIEPAMVERVSDLVRQTQALAVSQSWQIEGNWAKLAHYRAQCDEAMAAQKWRSALKVLGEAMSILGQAARVHRKTASKADAS